MALILRKNTCKIGLAAFVFAFGNLFFSSSVLAQTASPNPEENKLIVNFSSDPLFNASNFLPGDSETGEAEVINGNGETKKIATEAINYSGFPNSNNVPADDLSRVLSIVIREKDGGDLYGGSSPTGAKTLFDFYKNGETYLSDISGNGSKTYEFEIFFPETAGNEWNAEDTDQPPPTTFFDIIVGFQGEEGIVYCNNNGILDNYETGADCGGGGCSACANENNGGSVSGNNAGGGGLPSGLIISYAENFNASSNSVIIKWFTSYKATSQVVYAKADEAHTLNLSDNMGAPPKYGYAQTTQEFHAPASVNGVAYREIELTGLEENTTYYFRCISHASPPTVSREYSFTTQAKNLSANGENSFKLPIEEEAAYQLKAEELEKSALSGRPSSLPPALTADRPAMEPPVVSVAEPEMENNIIGEQQAEKLSEKSLFLAGIGRIATFGTGKAWAGFLVGIIAILIIGGAIYCFIQEERRKSKNQNKK